MCFLLQKGPKGEIVWTQRSDFRVPLEEELRRLLTPESVSFFKCFDQLFLDEKMEVWMFITFHLH
jgi:hypothetical protein